MKLYSKLLSVTRKCRSSQG